MKNSINKIMFLLISLAFLSCTAEETMPEKRLKFINPDGTSKELSVEVASNSGQRREGLMYRKTMDDDEGMIFIFDKEEPLSFWMKNTYLELDMVFLNGKKEVINVVKRAEPLTENPRNSDQPALYVVEIKGGLAEKFGITKGSKIEF